jgi:hypothetical protein
MRRAPRSCYQHNPGARLIHDAKAEGNQPTGRGEIHPRFPGEGVLMRHSSRPTNQCKGRSEPNTENSSDALPTQRFGPLAPDDRARRLAELRTVLAGAAPTFQARIRAGEQGERP